MNSKEAGILVDLDGKPIYWHLPQERSIAALPDSKDLWGIIWEARDRISGFAHSHPGSGIPSPSWTDLTTFAAIEAGLGARLTWWITSSDVCIALEWVGPGKHDYAAEVLQEHPNWLSELRHFSVDYQSPFVVYERLKNLGELVIGVNYAKEEDRQENR